MYRTLTMFGMISCALAVAAPAAAQGMSPFAVEARAGFAFPTGDFAADDAVESGTGFGVTGVFRLTPAFGLYAGWDRYAFEGEDDPEFPGVSAEIVDSGLAAGVQLSLPTAGLGLSPWLRGGALYRKAEADVQTGEFGSFGSESDYSLGFEVGGGIGIPLGQVLTFTPGVRYRAYQPEYEDLGVSTEGDVAYVSIDLGLTARF